MTIWDRYRDARDSTHGLAEECRNKARWFTEAHYFDEEYKLGDNPDIDALEQAARHLEQAYHLMNRFEKSCFSKTRLSKKSPPRLTKKQTPCMRVRFAESLDRMRRKYP